MKQLLQERAAQLGLELTPQQAAAFQTYRDMLVEWNGRMNLTAITDDEGIVTKHFVDSLMGLPYIPQEASLIDVGTGAGFPGVPLRIVRPDVCVTLLDALGKRVTFLEELTRALGLDDVSCVHQRAEEGSRLPALRERFDVAVSRAVADLSVLCELCLPYVKKGGVFLAYKGPGAAEEISRAMHAVEVLGGKLEHVADKPLPGTDMCHPVVVIRKVRQTPPKYPRMFAKIKKSPIS